MVTLLRKYRVLALSTILVSMLSALSLSASESNQLPPRRPLKILFFIDQFPGFGKRIAFTIATGLLERNHDVYLHVPHPPSTAALASCPADIVSRTFINELPKDIHTYDILLCNDGSLGKKVATLKRENKIQAKLVTCLRGTDISSYQEANAEAYKELLEQGDLFLPICQHHKHKLISLGCDPDRIVVLHSGIDCKQFAYQGPATRAVDQPCRLISCTRFAPKDGMLDAVHAVAQLIKKGIMLEYTLVGDGPQANQIRQLIQALGLEEQIHMIGDRNQEQVKQLLTESHIALYPSYTDNEGAQEGIPNSLKETMAVGRIVISTYHGGIPELIDNGVSGFLVAERDPAQLADTIEYVINHPEQWQAVIGTARTIIEERFDCDKNNEQLDTVLKSLVNRCVSTL